MRTKGQTAAYLIILTGEQLLHLQHIVSDLIAGKTVHIGAAEDDKIAGKKILKALEKAKRL